MWYHTYYLAGFINMNTIFWFKRDLRLENNKGLFDALSFSEKVYPVFIFDKNVCSETIFNDYKMVYLWNVVKSLKEQLRAVGSDLIIGYGDPKAILPDLVKFYGIDSIYSNEEYEPTIILRDSIIKTEIEKVSCKFIQSSDLCIFSPFDIEECSYGVSDFQTYKEIWLQNFEVKSLETNDISNLLDHFAKFSSPNIMPFRELGDYTTDISKRVGFNTSDAKKLLSIFFDKKFKVYNRAKNFPYLSSTSNMSVHLRFGTISARDCILYANNFAKTDNLNIQYASWLEQFILRDYYIQLYFHFPSVSNKPLNEMMSNYEYENNLEYFNKWCNGETGYPIIDASMKILNKTGLLHHKLRVLVASFLTKHLNVDYRLGEHYFSTRLLDYDPALSCGNWQTISGVNFDSQPFYKFLNPIIQSEKFDKGAKLIKKGLPHLSAIPEEFLHNPIENTDKWADYGVIIGKDYPLPVVDHKVARDNVLVKYKEFLVEY